MTAMNSRVSIPPRMKVAELASSLSKCRAAASETSNVNVNGNGNGSSSSSSRLASPLMIYQAGLILYEMSRRVDASDRTRSVNVNKNAKSSELGQNVSEGFDELRKGFVSLLSPASDSHLAEVVIGDITAAFLDISKSYRKRTLAKQNQSIVEDSDDDHTDVLEALRSLSGIFVQSGFQRVCKIGFDVQLCVEMALLYHHYLDLQSYDTHTDTHTDTIPGCILPTLSSLLIHGLILPHQNDKNNNQNHKNGHNHAVNEDNDDSIRKIMDVFQALASASPPAHHTNVYAQSMVGCCLGDLQEYHHKAKSFDKNYINTLQKAIDSIFHHKNDRYDTTQKDYLMQIIQSCPKSGTSPNQTNQTITSNNPDTIPTTTTSSNNPTSALLKLVHTVQSICPHLGEGYIEVALACYEHDTQKTITALIDADSDPKSLHPRLRVLDKNLPARKKESRSRYETLRNDGDDSHKNGPLGTDSDAKPIRKKDKETEEEQEAYRIQKRHLQEMGEREETQALNLSIAMRVGGGDEYDDDYDDQYDGIGNDGGGGRGGIGGADGGGGAYDVDLDAIRAYNKVAREMEEDRIFWEDSKNTNRRGVKVVEAGSAKKDGQQGPKTENNYSGGNEKTYRGPDKGKKGRAIGPDGKYLPITKGKKKKGAGVDMQPASATATDMKDDKNGGKKGTDSSSNVPGQAATGLTKIQKRRKNDNKAKLGNHHRKDRALKKAGM